MGWIVFLSLLFGGGYGGSGCEWYANIWNLKGDKSGILGITNIDAASLVGVPLYIRLAWKHSGSILSCCLFTQ